MRDPLDGGAEVGREMQLVAGSQERRCSAALRRDPPIARAEEGGAERVVRQRRNQADLERRASRTESLQRAGKGGGIVDDEDVAWAQDCRQVGDPRVAQGARARIDVE